MDRRQVIWKRLSGEGMDACRFMRRTGGWQLNGTAVYVQEDEVASLRYRVTCDGSWNSVSASVRGWVGQHRVSVDVHRLPDGGWHTNGKPVAGVRGLPDVDLGITPATNTSAIRRQALAIGDAMESTAVWLDPTDWTFRPLLQTYRRRAANRYAYESPAHDYSAELAVDDFGIVTAYPGLWQAVRVMETCDPA